MEYFLLFIVIYIVINNHNTKKHVIKSLEIQLEFNKVVERVLLDLHERNLQLSREVNDEL